MASARRLSYRDAGVDLDASSLLHDYASRILSGRRDAFTSAVEIAGSELVLHVDGVGTKTLVLQASGRLWVAGWDCVVMNTNDVACDSARPVALVDYIAMPSTDENAFKSIIEGVRKAARETGSILLGGETAILPGISRGIDVVCTVLAVRGRGWSGNRAHVGDVVVGVESSGLHANGYSLARKIVEEYMGGYDTRIDGRRLADILSTPTINYAGFLLEAWRNKLINAAVHVTGGAYTKAKRVLPDKAEMKLTLPEPPKIFRALLEAGNVDPWEAHRVWNMGYGLLLTTNPDNTKQLEKLARKHNLKTTILGEVRQHTTKTITLETIYGKLTY
ncbi:MAG: phosphoribosylformylglycinamidine cyclo-ligase [Hyperthermus sp.]|nr:MAG: phosphoribosylformylglycinamidine cyclo-ligase [Hyperthermus sp.]